MLVTSVDSTQPRFSQPHYWARVSEAAERRTPVLTLEAAAPSPAAAAQLGSPLVFQLSSPDQPPLFDVDFTTGACVELVDKCGGSCGRVWWTV